MTCTSSNPVDFCSTTFRKCLARSLPVLTHVGFPIAWTTAIPSIIVTWPAILLGWLSVGGGSTTKLSRIAISLLLTAQDLIVPSSAKSDRGNTANSNSPMHSCRFSSGRASITTRKRANSSRSSFMATSLSLVVHLLTFRVLFHMRSLTLFIGLQMLISLSTSLSWMNLSNISCPIELRWMMAFFTGSGMTALVIMFMTTSSATVKGSFTMRMSRSLLTFCSYRCSTEGDASWWRVCFVDTIPANVSASFDKWLNSDAIKNHLAMAAGCCVRLLDHLEFSWSCSHVQWHDQDQLRKTALHFC